MRERESDECHFGTNGQPFGGQLTCTMPLNSTPPSGLDQFEPVTDRVRDRER